MPYKDRNEHNKYRRERRKKLKEKGITEYSLWIKPYAERYAREKERAKNWNASEKGLKYYQNETELLTDGYIKRKLKHSGFNKNEITKELIEVKRLILKTKRL